MASPCPGIARRHQLNAELTAWFGPLHEAGTELARLLEKQVAGRFRQEIDTYFQRHQSQHRRRSGEEAVDVGRGLVFAGESKRLFMPEPAGNGRAKLFLQTARDIQE